MYFYILFFCLNGSGCLTYEFSDRVQCENTLKNMLKNKTGMTQLAFCQEVKSQSYSR